MPTLTVPTRQFPRRLHARLARFELLADTDSERLSPPIRRPASHPAGDNGACASTDMQLGHRFITALSRRCPATAGPSLRLRTAALPLDPEARQPPDLQCGSSRGGKVIAVNRSSEILPLPQSGGFSASEAMTSPTRGSPDRPVRRSVELNRPRPPPIREQTSPRPSPPGARPPRLLPPLLLPACAPAPRHHDTSALSPDPAIERWFHRTPLLIGGVPDRHAILWFAGEARH